MAQGDAADLPLQSVLHHGGSDAAIIGELAWGMTIGAALIFVALMALLALSLRRHARPLGTRVWIAGAGILFPIVVLTMLLAWSTWRSAQLRPQSSNGALAISVTAKMWWWEVRYPGPGGGEIVAANEIHIPAGREVYLGLNADDVIHSLWIPALGGKRDIIPGRVTGLRLRADKPGVYRGQCAEYCGVQHARMALHVIAHAPADFDAWLGRQAQAARPPAAPLQARGRAVFLEQNCQSCHTVRGVAEGSRLGQGLAPDLTHIGSRAYLGAGTLRTGPATLAAWIANPHVAKPGVFMPATADLDADALRALAAYLESLQ